MKLRLGLLVSLIILSGCGLPPAIVVASYAVDGFSYMASGKSLTDHAMSALAQQDCALHRVITQAELCRAVEEDGPRMVAIAPAPVPEVVTASVEPAVAELASVEPVLTTRRLTPRWGPVDGTQTVGVVREDSYLVVASFAYWVNTDRFMTAHSDLAPEVVAAEVDGEVVYRVVTFAGRQAVSEAGIEQAWPLRLCRDVEDVLAPCGAERERAINIAALAH